MKRSGVLLTLLLAILSIEQYSVCSEVTYDQIAREKSSVWENPAMIEAAAKQFDERISDAIATNVFDFAYKLGQQIVDQPHFVKAEVFSPISIMSALALLMLGAKGRSYQELKQVFGIDNDAELRDHTKKFHTEFGAMLEDMQQHEVSLLRPRKNADWRQTMAKHSIRRNSSMDARMEHITKVANGVFPKLGYTLNPDYIYTIKSVYHSLLEPLDYDKNTVEARNFINKWVDQNTYGRIPEVIPSGLSSETSVIIVSTLYFKAFWEYSFLDFATKEDDFYPDGKNQAPIKVKMMATAGVFPYHYSQKYDCHILGLPYQDQLATMYIIQPHYSTRSKLKGFQQFLNSTIVEELIAQMSKVSGIITLPKMHLQRGSDIKELLIGLGIKDIFINGISDLSLIANNAASAQATNPTNNKFIENRFTGIFDNVTNISDRRKALYEQNLNEQQDNTESRTKRQVRGTFDRAGRERHLSQLESDRAKETNDKVDLYVQQVVHNIDIDINERGTIAAAATAAILTKTGPELNFRTDTPFLFLIRHDPTKLVLFYGIINEPELI